MNNLLFEIIDNPDVVEKFNEAYKHVRDNMWDENTKATAKRKITLDIIFEQDNGREFVDINTAIKETLAPKVMKVKVIGAESQLEGQMTIRDFDGLEMAADAELKAAKEKLREHGIDPDTGKVIN